MILVREGAAVVENLGAYRVTEEDRVGSHVNRFPYLASGTEMARAVTRGIPAAPWSSCT